MATKIQKYGIEAVQGMNVKTAIAKVDILPNLLAGYDADGKLILATNATGAYVPATTMIKEGSEQKFGEAFAIIPNRPLRAGRETDVYKQFIVYVDANTYSVAQYDSPVYLGVDGAFTLTKPVTTGALAQVIGQVLDHDCVLIDLTKDPKGTEV